MISAYFTTRLAAFTAMLATFGTSLSYKDVTVQCLATPKEEVKELQRADVFPKRQTIFSISRADYLNLITMGFGLREVVKSANDRFEVYSIIDDDAEPTVDLRCNLKV